mmetsp:Transcript_2376/g.7951  ORF Transcript_2376/g.7951 Transcript_2376/m.7951 type:complete len:257 (+) Transcript_2376:1152-1922(+)
MDMSSSLSMLIDLSRLEAKPAILDLTASSASAILSAKVSLVSLRLSFLTESDAGILTSSWSSSSYISITCPARSSSSAASSLTKLTISQWSEKSRSERGCSDRSRILVVYSCSELVARSRATVSSRPRHLSSAPVVTGMSAFLSVFESMSRLRSGPKSFIRSSSRFHRFSWPVSFLKAAKVSDTSAVACFSAYASKFQCAPKMWMTRYSSKICEYCVARSKSSARHSSASRCTRSKRTDCRTILEISGPSTRPMVK